MWGVGLIVDDWSLCYRVCRWCDPTVFGIGLILPWLVSCVWCWVDPAVFGIGFVHLCFVLSRSCRIWCLGGPNVLGIGFTLACLVLGWLCHAWFWIGLIIAPCLMLGGCYCVWYQVHPLCLVLRRSQCLVSGRFYMFGVGFILLCLVLGRFRCTCLIPPYLVLRWCCCVWCVAVISCCA